MVSLIQYGNGSNSIYAGLSSDEKPIATENGAAFIEMDTSKVYFFDAGNSEWLEWGAESNATSNAASSLSMTRPSLTLGNTLSPDVVEPDVMEEAVLDMAEEKMPEVAEDIQGGEDE